MDEKNNESDRGKIWHGNELKKRYGEILIKALVENQIQTI